MTLKELKEILNKQGVEVSDLMLEQLDSYAKYLIEANQVMNLTAINEYQEIIEKHFYDSIRPFINHVNNESILDVGSGAGFPSIPLKIIYNQLSITIVEPTKKRCVFLENLVSKLSLNNVTIINARAEDYINEKREYFDIVTARAVASMNILAELCIPFVKVNGRVIVLKGSKGNQEYIEAKNAIRILGCKLVNIDEYNLSDDSKRTNFYFIKINKTDKKYPRHYSKIKNKPLQ